jgi:hypothetical protein
MEIQYRFPHRYRARSYQLPLLQSMWAGTVTRGVTVWHRRSGKDTTWLNLTIAKMPQRVGTYIHLFPELKRGRKILWEGKNRDGMAFLDHFPPGFLKRRREDEMLVEAVNGSMWRIEGVENINSVIGMNPIGIVFSEFSQMRRDAWDLIRPILLENGGWAGFNFTPRGRNHAYDLAQMAAKEPDWYYSLLTVQETRRDGPGENGQPIITPQMIDDERRSGMREALIEQEYLCSFEAGSALQFISGEIIRAAFARDPMPWPWSPKILGIDVGRNRDRSVLLLRQGGQILEKVVIHPYQATDNPSENICNWATRIMQAHAPQAIFVDGVGIGVGVVDGLQRRGYKPVSVLGNSQSPEKKYYNLRAYMWGTMRDWLRTEGQLQRPRDDTLDAELQAPQFNWKKDQEWLTPKDELEGGDDVLEFASPDEADALALTFASPVAPLPPLGAQPRRPAQVDWDVMSYDHARV